MSTVKPSPSPPSPASKKQKLSHKTPLKFLSYNILEQSLSSSTIPWLLTFPPSFLPLLETLGHNEESLTSLKKDIETEYKNNWHKNIPAGNYKMLRTLFGSTFNSLLSTFFLDNQLNCTKIDSNTLSLNATTLKNIFKIMSESLTLPLNSELITLLKSYLNEQEKIYSFPLRAPKLYNRVISEDPDIVVFLEYDIHGPAHNVNPEGCFTSDVADLKYVEDKCSSFSVAFNDLGYTTLLFCSPYRHEKSLGSGVGIYFKSERFEVKDFKESNHRVDVGDELNDICCVDMMEQVGGEVLDLKERRSLAHIKLFDKINEEYINVIGIHLMTKSKDRTGEIRENELIFLKEYVESLEGQIIIGGDFNIDLSRELQILEKVNYSSNSLNWSQNPLKNSHAANKGITSKTSRREENIDYCFTNLEVIKTSVKNVNEVIPNENEGSDHIPIWAVLK